MELKEPRRSWVSMGLTLTGIHSMELKVFSVASIMLLYLSSGIHSMELKDTSTDTGKAQIRRESGIHSMELKEGSTSIATPGAKIRIHSMELKE